LLKENHFEEQAFRINPFTPTFGSIPMLLAGGYKEKYIALLDADCSLLIM
jgi:hypothetical protein